MPTIGQVRSEGRGRSSLALAWTEFVGDAVNVSNRSGPSPAFVIEPRRGRGLHLDWDFASLGTLTFLGTIAHERVPMGFRLDARRADHPGVPLPFDVQDLNLTTSFKRVSFGLGIAHARRLGPRLVARVDMAVLRHFINVGQFYHQGVGARTDTASTWVMSLDARILQPSSTWHVRMRVGVEYSVWLRHAVGLFLLHDQPFGDTFSDGRVTLFGSTEHRTTLEFRQRGAITGVCATYRYAWGNAPPSPGKKE